MTIQTFQQKKITNIPVKGVSEFIVDLATSHGVSYRKTPYDELAVNRHPKLSTNRRPILSTF